MTENWLRWFEHLQRRPQEALVIRVDCISFSPGKGEEGDRKRRRRKSSKEILDLIIFLKLWFLTMSCCVIHVVDHI